MASGEMWLEYGDRLYRVVGLVVVGSVQPGQHGAAAE